MVMVSASDHGFACIVSSLILRNIIILTGQLCIYKYSGILVLVNGELTGDRRLVDGECVLSLRSSAK